MFARSILLPFAVAAALGGGTYDAEVRAWREAREKALKANGGWLSVAGLFWLKEGPNTFGADSANDIVLPGGPPRAGVFELHDGKVTLARNGAAQRPLRPDSAGAPDVVKVQDLTLFVIQRGERYGIRLKDPNSRFRSEFTGLHWFPVKESAHISARFVPAPSKIPVPNILGQTEPLPSPGYAVFTWQGQEVRLYPVLETPDAKSLFFIFRDQTSGKETYGAGRFLDTELPRDGKVVLDFNRAYNPPCAFTPYATCPLPPKPNRLAVRIDAGELKYGNH